MAAKDTATELFDLVNNSGFPFQMAVTHQITQSRLTHGWRIAAEEHPWKHPDSACDGFADQILQHERYATFRAVCECKRFKNKGKWAFLKSPDQASDTGLMSVFWVYGLPNQKTDCGWIDFPVTPDSPQTSFCVLLNDNDRRTMFERISDDLLPSIEAIGLEEMSLIQSQPGTPWEIRFYLPVVITNALLYTASFDPAMLDMNSGELPPGTCDFKQRSERWLEIARFVA
jgi:hypothetical protein